ncbi:MAG: hypothetical protein KGZ81_02130 [Flavobacteriales bacterium]|jgi:hypothetical protein|nr:hypothetical protein [Flavobacteriales bacterium]
MIWVIRILFVLVLGFIGYGWWLNGLDSNEGDKFVGIGVLLMSLVFMPVFLFHRYKNKKLSDYTFKFDEKTPKKPENQ